jgi:hypothetical protein
MSVALPHAPLKYILGELFRHKKQKFIRHSPARPVFSRWYRTWSGNSLKRLLALLMTQDASALFLPSKGGIIFYNRQRKCYNNARRRESKFAVHKERKGYRPKQYHHIYLYA